MSSDELLIIVVDATTLSWSALDAEAERISSTPDGLSVPRLSSFPEFLVALETFLSAFATCSRRNKLAVIGYNGHEGGYLYPPPPPPPPSSSSHGIESSEQSVSNSLLDGDLLRPAVIKRFVRRGLLRLRYGLERCEQAVIASVSAQNSLTTSESVSSVSVDEEIFLTRSFPISTQFNSLGNCLTLALCFSQRLKREAVSAGKKALPSRIVTFKVADDVPANYIAIINAAFSAHRLSIPIDSCIVGLSQSPYLQQSAYLTQGITLRPDFNSGHHSHLIQYLLSLFLPDSKTRKNELLMPPQLSVDLKATCFCHKRGVYEAWLCFVCLAVWCQPGSKCLMCGTLYDLNKNKLKE